MTVTCSPISALYRHDAQFDLTREQAFTPSAEAREIVRGLKRAGALAYFYQKQDPARPRRGDDADGCSSGSIRYFRVESVDTDQNPALASRLGVQVYNTAVLRPGDRRIEVMTTDEREIALASCALCAAARS